MSSGREARRGSAAPAFEHDLHRVLLRAPAVALAWLELAALHVRVLEGLVAAPAKYVIGSGTGIRVELERVRDLLCCDLAIEPRVVPEDVAEDLGGRHVVQQQPRRARGQRRVDLRVVAHLDRDRQVRPRRPRAAAPPKPPRPPAPSGSP